MAECEEILKEEPIVENSTNEEKPNEVPTNETNSEEIPENQSEPPADNIGPNRPEENETATPQEDQKLEEVDSPDIKNENNIVTVELSANANAKESSEIVVVPKVAEKHHSLNGKHVGQSVGQNKPLRVSTPIIELLEVSEDQMKGDTQESRRNPPVDNMNLNKPKKSATNTSQEDKEFLEVASPEIKMESNVMTEELSRNAIQKESPEVVVMSNVANRYHTLNGKHIRQKALKVSTPKYYPLPSEKTTTTAKTKHSFTVPAKSFVKPIKRFIIYMILSMIFIGYAIGGAYLFSHLEKQREIEYNAKIDKWKNDTAILLATELRQVSPYEAVWARKVFHYLEVYEKDLLKASSVGYRRLDDKDRDQRWTWSSSLFFSISLMTTTGYGSMTPRSKLGRTSTVVYSLFGIPLAFCWFMATGRMLAIGFTSIFRTVCCSTCGNDESLSLNNIIPEPLEGTRKKPGRFRSNSVAPVDEQILIAQPNHHLHQYSQKMNSTKSGNRQNSQLRPKNVVPDCQNPYCLAARVYFETCSFETGNTFRMIDFMMALVYSLLFFVVFFAFCSVTFAMYEEWELTDMFYFNYLTLVTVGPGCHELENESLEIKLKNDSKFLMFVVPAYCLLSMIVNLMYLMIAEKRSRHQGELKWKALNG